MIDKMYVKDLEKLISKQERMIQKLEKEKMSREAAAAAFAEYFIDDNDTIPGGLASDMRALLRRFKFYPVDKPRESNFVSEVDAGDYKLLEKAIKKLFCVELKDLHQYGLHLDINEDNNTHEYDDEPFLA
jgi:hypothetical protein